jgi:hypothetical protein
VNYTYFIGTQRGGSRLQFISYQWHIILWNRVLLDARESIGILKQNSASLSQKFASLSQKFASVKQTLASFEVKFRIFTKKVIQELKIPKNPSSDCR